MKMSKPFYVEDTNLSRAWGQAFLEMTRSGVDEITPLVVIVTGFIDGQPVEIPSIRRALDDTLESKGKFSCQTVASTIFPRSQWNPNLNREILFRRYLRTSPLIRKRDRHNSYGTYFERLIDFGPQHKNQLNHIIETRLIHGNNRRSAMQASIFDPNNDHTDQRQRGFPCMQHVTFAPQGDKGLVVTGFYATQYMFERAYRNYLGLCDLGHFMAHELGRQLTQLTCFTGIALREKSIDQKSIEGLRDHIKRAMNEANLD